MGDAAHAARKSQHNPNTNPKDAIPDGAVVAIDVTHDPANGCDAGALANALAASNDSRLLDGGYIIWNRKIWNPKIAKAWRPYGGTNPHTKHVHIGVGRDVDSTTFWAIEAAFGAKPPEVVVKPLDPALSKPLLKKGVKDVKGVKELQTLLAGLGLYKGKIDGAFGTKTHNAVIAFQKAKGLAQDGKVGPYTWDLLLPDAGAPVTAPAPVATPKPVATPAVPASQPKPDPVVMEAWYATGHYPLASEFAEAWCEKLEEFRALPYDDRGSLAQGFGHNAASGVAPIPVKGGDAWTTAYAREVMRADLKLQVHYVKAYVKVPLKQCMVDALALDCFQQGPGNFRKSAVVAKLNSGDYAGAAQALRTRPFPAGLGGLGRRWKMLAAMFDGQKTAVATWDDRSTWR